jgi:hypothetical protein
MTTKKLDPIARERLIDTAYSFTKLFVEKSTTQLSPDEIIALFKKFDDAVIEQYLNGLGD